LDQAKSAVLNSLTSGDAQRGYRHAIDEFVEWYCSEPRLSFSRTVVLRYRIHLESRHLAPGTINLRLGAVRCLAYEAADCGLLSPDLAAGIRRVKGLKKIGVRLGNWLTAEQSQRLWQAPNGERLKEKRDRALPALLLACGVRRHEAVELNFGHIPARQMKHLTIGALIFPRMDQIDFTGPFEVLSRIPNSTIYAIAKTKSPVRDIQGLILTPGMSIAEGPELDVLLVPGGYGQQQLMDD
jgi:integrase